MNIIELPIQTASSLVIMKSHQVRRDTGRTSQAAARLALYRLRKFLRLQQMTAVDDITLTIPDHPDYFTRNQKAVVADVRCVKSCPEIGETPFRVPRSTTYLKIARH